MEQYIDKDALVAEIEKRIKETQSMQPKFDQFWAGQISAFKGVLKIIDTLEVKEVDNFLTSFISFKDMVNIQYPSVNDGIKAHAETYSFNIESELFNQLTPEQQKLWRKEIEQACISGGKMGVELARDTRYKENLKVKEVDLDKEIKEEYLKHRRYGGRDNMLVILNEPQFNNIAKHFFELGLKAQKGK